MFLAMPPALKSQVYAALAHALDPTSPNDRYDYIRAAEKTEIRAILRDTHPELGPLLTPL